MTIQKKQQKFIGKAKGAAKSALVLLVLPLCFSSAFADGFGVSDGQAANSNANSAKINALLKSVNSNQPTQVQQAPAQPAAASQVAAPAPTKDPVGDKAFADSVRYMLPMTPEQIKTLHYLFSKTQQAAAQYPGVPPKPTSTSLIVNLSPGSAPPVVRLQKGYISSLVFVDATGAPWPIAAEDLGDSKSFNVSWDKKGNTLLVQALDSYKAGNLAVMLKGLNTPVMVSLIPGQHAVDYRVDFRVPKLGPNANPQLAGLPQGENPSLMSVLDGVPPQGSRALVIEGGDAKAWMAGSKLYLRTPMTLVSPAFISTMSSPDGTHAYELQVTPVILAQYRGKTVQLTIKGL